MKNIVRVFVSNIWYFLYIYTCTGLRYMYKQCMVTWKT